MLKVIGLLAILGILGSCAQNIGPQEAQQLEGSSAKVIYGEDGREEAEYTPMRSLRTQMNASVALISGDSLTDNGMGGYTLPTDTFGSSMGMCADEPYANQINPAHCSGSLVAPDVVLTAGHCVTTDYECEDTKFVLDFKTHNGSAPTTIHAANVYSCKKLMKSVLDHGLGADWALIQLDRPVTDRAPVTLGDSDVVGAEHRVTVIGYPAGLPMKVTEGGKIRSKTDTHFVASVDTYGGNSGSPVFSDVTGEQIGILVRGEQDYAYDSEASCTRSFICEEEECRGEDLTLINLPKSFLDGTYVEEEPIDEPFIDDPLPHDPGYDYEPEILFTIQITAQQLNVRLSPDTGNQPCGTYRQGEYVNVIGIDPDTGWYRVSTESDVPSPAVGIFEETCWGRDAYISGNSRYSRRVN